MINEKYKDHPLYFLDEIGFLGQPVNASPATKRWMDRRVAAFLRKEKKEAELALKAKQKEEKTAQKAN